MMKFTFKLITLTAVSFLTAAAEAETTSFRTVAITGDPAPDTQAGVTFGTFNQGPTIDANGTVIFETALQGEDITFANTEAIFTSNADGSFTRVVQGGDPAPGAPGGENFVFVNLPKTGPGGEFTFVATLPGSLSSLFGFDTEMGLTSLGIEGQPVSGVPVGVLIDSFSQSTGVVDGSGKATTLAFLTGAGVNFSNNSALLTQDDNGDLTIVVREGDPAPGVAPGSLFGGNSFADVATNVDRQIAFTTSLLPPGGNATPQSAVFLRNANGDLQPLAVEGQQVPNAPLGVEFGFILGDVRINRAGQTLFGTQLTENGNLFQPTSAIISSTGGGLEIVARTGEAAPGFAPGVTLENLVSSALINDAGQIAFAGQFQGTGIGASNDSAIFLENNVGDFEVVAREGESAPGIDDGAVFDDFLPTGFAFNFPGLFALNDDGQLAFLADLAGTGVNNSNDQGLFAIDGNGELQLIAREGDLFDVDDDPLTEDLRTIEAIDFTAGSGGGDGFSIAFNDLGDLAFALEFTDGTEGLFVASLPVPEPTGLFLLTIGVCLACGKNRRR